MAEFNEDAKEELKAIEREELINRLKKEGVTGQLWNVHFISKNDFDERSPNLAGYVQVDVKGRFSPGEKVYTSTIEKIYTDESGRTFAKTRYSLYELLDFNPEEIPEDFRYAYE